MGALVVGLIGMAVVGVVGRRDYRAGKTADERLSHLHHTITFLLTFLCFCVGPGIAAMCGVLDDPLFGSGPTVPLVTAGLGVVAAVVAVCGAVVVQRNTNPTRRGFLIRLHVSMALSFLAFFTAPACSPTSEASATRCPGSGRRRARCSSSSSAGRSASRPGSAWRKCPSRGSRRRTARR
ncbi:hypothetical protein J0H58_30500 [bacterium]|nr:hypothetical protein [bacterium]